MPENKKTLSDFLNQSYPGTSHRWLICLSISAFIALFLLVFQPFGLSTYRGSDKYLLILGYGMVTLVVLIIDLFILPFFFKKWFIPEDWTILKQLIMLFWILFTIGVANTYYTSFVFSFELNLNTLLTFQLSTLAVGFIPIIVLTFWNQNKLLKKNLKMAENLNQKLKVGLDENVEGEVISLKSSNEKDEIELSPSQILFIASVGNYVQIHFIRDNEVKKEMMRNTISRIEEQLHGNETLFKCHRAFIVNLSKVEVIRGNAQGLKVKLKMCDEDIPVSRNYTKAFRSKVGE